MLSRKRNRESRSRLRQDGRDRLVQLARIVSRSSRFLDRFSCITDTSIEIERQASQASHWRLIVVLVCGSYDRSVVRSIVLAPLTLSPAIHTLRELSHGPRVDRVTEPVSTESFRASSLYSFVRLDLSHSFRCNRYNFCFKLRLRVEKY